MVGFGGINSAGRLSFNHAYRRLVIDQMSQAQRDRTYRSLGELMGQDDHTTTATRKYIDANTLIRRIDLFDPDRVIWQSAANLNGVDDEVLSFVLSKRQLPERPPADWQIKAINDKEVRVTTTDPLRVLLPEERTSGCY